MKSLLVFIALFSTPTVFANSSAAMPMSTSSVHLDDVELENDVPLWNVNLGMSTFSGGELNADGLKGNGVAIELQRRIGDYLYLGASYAFYNTEYTVQEQYSDVTKIKKAAADVIGGSVEFHPIHLELQRNSEFFASVFGGAMTTLDQTTEFAHSSLYFGAGLGMNYSNQIGVRADMKTNREFASFTSVSLVGYY